MAAMLSTLTPPSTTSVDGVDARTRELELRQCLGDERLAAESRIDRHDQHEVELLEHMVEPDQWSRRIENETGLATAVVDESDRTVDVIRRFGMETYDRGFGLGEVGHDAVDRLHHQVHVDGYGGVRLQRLAHLRADRQVGHVMVVHHVE